MKFAIVFVATVAACQAAKPAPTSPAALPNWSAMNRTQRMDHMGLVVMPAMEKLFKEHNSVEFAEFGCQDCHGDGFDKPPIDFRMPNTLLALDARDPITQNLVDHPETTKFMMENVVPTMAGLLGTKPYDAASKSGFGCFGCHPMAMPAP